MPRNVEIFSVTQKCEHTVDNFIIFILLYYYDLRIYGWAIFQKLFDVMIVNHKISGKFLPRWEND